MHFKGRFYKELEIAIFDIIIAPNPPTNIDIDNCEYEGVLGTLGGIIGTIQANEVIKEIIGIGESLCGYILIIDGLKLTFRKVKLNKRNNCQCYEKN